MAKTKKIKPRLVEMDEAYDMLKQVVTDVGFDHICEKISVAEMELVDDWTVQYLRDHELDLGFVYFTHGQPSCLVGHIFARLGVSSEHVTEGEPVEITLTDDSPIRLSGGAASILSCAQYAQDDSESWGSALDKCAYRYAELKSLGTR